MPVDTLSRHDGNRTASADPQISVRVPVVLLQYLRVKAAFDSNGDLSKFVRGVLEAYRDANPLDSAAVAELGAR